MTNLPEWVTRIKILWTTIGTIIALVGIKLPAFLPDGLFSNDFASLLVTAIGAVLALVQFFRAEAPAGVEFSTLSAPNKTAFALNPFKLYLRA